MGPPVTVRLDPMEHVFVHRHVNGIRLLHGDRYVLLHRYGHVFLHRDRYHLLHGKRNLFLHWDRHSLHHGDRHRLRDRYVNWKRLWYSYGDRMWNSYRHWLSNWHTCGRIESPNWAAIRRIFIVPRDTSVIEVSIIWEIKERERVLTIVDTRLDIYPLTFENRNLKTVHIIPRWSTIIIISIVG